MLRRVRTAPPRKYQPDPEGSPSFGEDPRPRDAGRRVYLLPPGEGGREFPHGSTVFLTSCACFSPAL